ncbi:MAG: translesion error-prone DNA polymerase V autoproteolytic subunit [Lentisphaerae bacterium]|nr:translesion error-prone DNA polymerase V autoproteolytic subunit [Lentisphaerota bacterium]
MTGMEMKIQNVYIPDTSTKRTLPYYEAKVPAGFPSPASDYEEGKLDLNKHLIKNPAATFFVRVSGSSMVGAGINDGDLLVVDRSLEPRNGNVVIAVIDGDLTLKRIRIRGKKIILEPENSNYEPQEISENCDFQVWGVVTNVVHEL